MRRGFRHLCDLEERRELLQAWEGVCSRQNKLCAERHSCEMELGILRLETVYMGSWRERPVVEPSRERHFL